MKHKLIIIPDIHGRGFWRDAVPFVEQGAPAVFLGDYTDPYAYEGITVENAVANFLNLLDFARQHSDRVTLLLGNHDLSYFGHNKDHWYVGADRYSNQWAASWRWLFNDNADLFALCTLRTVRGRRYLLTHAGVHPEWTEALKTFNDIDRTDLVVVAERLESMFQESLHSSTQTDLMMSLSMVGNRRGGIYLAGSPVWADCHEFDDVEYPGVAQIFGHSQQVTIHSTESGVEIIPGKARVRHNNYCIDCHRCFFLDGNGQLRYLDNNEKVK